MSELTIVRKNFLVVIALAGAAFSQTAAKPSASTASAKPAKPVTKPQTAAKPKAQAASKPAKMAKPAMASAAHPAKPVKKSTKHKAAAPPAASASAAGATSAAPAAAPVAKKRDPFVNPIQAVREGRNGSCTGGKRCLDVSEIVLRGVVKSVGGMIAVVENAAQRTYFLHENDAIYNGSVQKITPDTVVFREHYTDNLGRDQVREVVKSVNAPAV